MHNTSDAVPARRADSRVKLRLRRADVAKPVRDYRISQRFFRLIARSIARALLRLDRHQLRINVALVGWINKIQAYLTALKKRRWRRIRSSAASM